MRYVLALSLFTLIIFSLLHNVLWLSAIATVLFSLRFGATALVPLAIVIDGYFGNFHSVPYLSLFSIVWYSLVEYIRPTILHRWSSS